MGVYILIAPGPGWVVYFPNLPGGPISSAGLSIFSLPSKPPKPPGAAPGVRGPEQGWIFEATFLRADLQLSWDAAA